VPSIFVTYRRSTSSLDAMGRARIAALLVLLWTALQAWFLVRIGFDFGGHRSAWVICVLGLALAVALWFQMPWARICCLGLGGLLLVLYVGTIFTVGTSCSGASLMCYGRILSQPALVAGILVTLFKPLASNNRMEQSGLRLR
jgi:hypothetical protein